MEILGNNKILEKPALSYGQILEKERESGKKLDERFALRISQARDLCFERLKVSSSEEVIDLLKNGMPKFPVGFHCTIHLIDYYGEVGALEGGEETYVCLLKEKEEADEKNKKPLDEEEEDILATVKGILSPNEKMVGMTWKAKGLEYKGKLHEYEHNGVMVDKIAKNKNFGFAMYRTHEAVFGKMEKEITPKLSLLKLYLKLGFVPKKIINPENEEELPMDVEAAVERYFSSGNEELPFLVYLEKEK